MSSKEVPETQAKLGESGAFLDIIWTSEHRRRCSSQWLRVNCHCAECKSTVNTTVLGDITKVSQVQISGDDLECTISDNDGKHLTSIPLQHILSTCTCQTCLGDEIKRRKATPECSAVTYLQFEQASSSDKGRLEFLKAIVDHGFCILRDVPVNDSDITINFVRSMGGVRYSFYGHDFEVYNRGEPINAAYTLFKLPSHNDLTMYETSPGVQFLLAIRFDEEVIGGDSILLDGFKCAEVLRQKHPDHFKTLCRVPTTYDSVDLTRDNPVWFWNSKPRIMVDYFGEIVAVNAHPGSESTLRIREEDEEPYYEAHKAFTKILEDPQYQVTFRLRQGDMMVLNNLRMMHARTSYIAAHDGARHLFGFYMDLDDLRSHYMEIAGKLGKTVSPPKIWTRSSF